MSQTSQARWLRYHAVSFCEKGRIRSTTPSTFPADIRNIVSAMLRSNIHALCGPVGSGNRR